MGEFYKRAKPIPGQKLQKTGENPNDPTNGEQVFENGFLKSLNKLNLIFSIVFAFKMICFED